MNQNVNSFESLPQSIHEMILTHLPAKDGFKMRRISRTFNAIMADQNIRNAAVRRNGHNIAPGLITYGTDNYINHYLGRPTSSVGIFLQHFKDHMPHAEAEVKLCGKCAMWCFVNENVLEVQINDLRTDDIRFWQVDSISLRKGGRVEDLFLSDDVVGVRIDRELLWCRRDSNGWNKTPLATDVYKAILVGPRFYALKAATKGKKTIFQSIWCFDTNAKRSSWDRFSIDFDPSNQVPRPIAWTLYNGDGYTDVFLFAEHDSGHKAMIVYRLSPTGNTRWMFDKRQDQVRFTDLKGDLSTAQLDLEITPATNTEEYYICFWRRSDRMTFHTRRPQARFAVLFQLQDLNIFTVLPISVGYGEDIYSWNHEFRYLLACIRRRQLGRPYAYQSELGWNEHRDHELHCQAIAANDDYVVCMVAEWPASIHLRVFAFDGIPSINPHIPGNPPTTWAAIETDRYD